jgi:hypothetical protein
MISRLVPGGVFEMDLSKGELHALKELLRQTIADEEATEENDSAPYDAKDPYIDAARGDRFARPVRTAVP